MSWIVLLLSGCAVKGTYHIAQAELAVSLAQEDEAEELAVYAWTMVDAYLKKVREEYFYADYEAAEQYALAVEEWAECAREVVRRGADPMNSAPDALPELQDAPPPLEDINDDFEFDLEDE
jgi:hypothetical protein